MGELRLFCLQGYDLYESLIKRQRSLSSTRLLSSPLPPIPTTPPATPPRSLFMGRRMSRSENDLQRTFLQGSFLKQRSQGNSPARLGTCPDSLSSAGGLNKVRNLMSVALRRWTLLRLRSWNFSAKNGYFPSDVLVPQKSNSVHIWQLGSYVYDCVGETPVGTYMHITCLLVTRAHYIKVRSVRWLLVTPINRI